MELTVQVPEGHDSIGVLGSAERNLKMIRESLGVRVSARAGVVRLQGNTPEITIARNVLERLRRDAQRSRALRRDDPATHVGPFAERERDGDSMHVRDGYRWLNRRLGVSRDVIELMDRCAARVHDAFGVVLEREVVVWTRGS